MSLSVEVKFTGLKQALEALKKAETQLEQPIKDSLLGGGQLIRSEAVKSIQQGSKTGKIYEKYNPRRTHRASAPGEAPASDTGNLVRNIIVKNTDDTVSVESNANYSKFLEYGTSKMLPRPFLFPAYEKSREKIVKSIFLKIVTKLKELSK